MPVLNVLAPRASEVLRWRAVVCATLIGAFVVSGCGGGSSTASDGATPNSASRSAALAVSAAGAAPSCGAGMSTPATTAGTVLRLAGCTLSAAKPDKLSLQFEVVDTEGPVARRIVALDQSVKNRRISCTTDVLGRCTVEVPVSLSEGGLTASSNQRRTNDAVQLKITYGAAVAQRAKVFILAGQSNALGAVPNSELSRFAPSLLTPRGDVFIETRIANARPLSRLGPGFGQSDAEFGPELRFGQVVGDTFSEPVYIFKAAQGGTALYKAADWMPTSAGGNARNLYAQLVDGFKSFARTELAGKGIDYEVAGVLWFQGENDAADGQHARYESNLRHFIAALRADLQLPALPIVITQINDTWGSNGTAVMAAQAKVAAEANNALVYTADQRPYFHYGAASIVEIGDRMALAMLTLMGGSVAGHDTYTAAPDALLQVPAAQGVLINDRGSSPRVLHGAQHGVLTLATDGGFSYTPNRGFIGTDSFTYRVSSNGASSNIGQVALRVRDANDPLVLNFTFDGPDPAVDSASGLRALVRGPAPETRPGKRGAAACFNGSSVMEYLMTYPAPDDLDLNTSTDFSIATWVKTAAGSTAASVLTSNEYYDDLDWGYRFGLGANGRGLKAVVGAVDATGAKRKVTLGSTSPVALNDGHWHHVAVTVGFSTGRMTLYADGVAVGQGDISSLKGALVRFESTLGGAPDGGESPLRSLDGCLDEFQHYRKALSSTEIQALAR